MRLFFAKWKKIACLYMAVLIVFVEKESACLTARALAGYDGQIHSSNIVHLVCTPKNITVDGAVWADVQPAGAEIYRAKIKENGKRGSFRQIGVCREMKRAAYNQGEWNFTYKDSTVKSGQAYVYKCKGFIQTGSAKKFQEENIRTGKGVAAKKAGKYTCKVVKNTEKKLIVKLIGKSKNNGPLECNIGIPTYNNSVSLVFKNKGKAGGLYTDVKSEAYSYNGKKWYKGKAFRIEGKESVYLRFSRAGHAINVSDYQYVQMMMLYVKYNLSPLAGEPDGMPQLRFNLTSGEALTGQFLKTVDYKQTTAWDGNVFDRYEDNVYERP